MADKFLAWLKRTVLSHRDRVSGIALVVVATFAIADAAQLPFGSIRAPDAGFFPQSLSVLLLIFGIVILLGSFFKKSEPAEFGTRSWLVLVAAAAFIAYAFLLPKAGFALTTIAIMLLIMRGLGGMKWGQALLIAVPSVLLSYFAFLQLGVPLPRGPLPF